MWGWFFALYWPLYNTISARAPLRKSWVRPWPETWLRVSVKRYSLKRLNAEKHRLRKEIPDLVYLMLRLSYSPSHMLHDTDIVQGRNLEAMRTACFVHLQLNGKEVPICHMAYWTVHALDIRVATYGHDHLDTSPKTLFESSATVLKIFEICNRKKDKNSMFCKFSDLWQHQYLKKNHPKL